MEFSKASPSTSAVLIVSANPYRTSLTLINKGNVTVYINKHSGVSVATGFPIESKDSLIMERYTEALYGITESGTGDIRVAEAND